MNKSGWCFNYPSISNGVAAPFSNRKMALRRLVGALESLPETQRCAVFNSCRTLQRFLPLQEKKRSKKHTKQKRFSPRKAGWVPLWLTPSLPVSAFISHHRRRRTGWHKGIVFLNPRNKRTKTILGTNHHAQNDAALTHALSIFVVLYTSGLRREPSFSPFSLRTTTSHFFWDDSIKKNTHFLRAHSRQK